MAQPRWIWPRQQWEGKGRARKEALIELHWLADGRAHEQTVLEPQITSGIWYSVQCYVVGVLGVVDDTK